MELSMLLVEYAVAPLAIDTATPRFTWILSSTARGQSQSAYQVSVTAASDTGAPGQPVWDSGKVVSSRSAHVPYGGEALASNTRYNYTVTVWDQNGVCATGSSTFATALLGDNEWRSDWIGAGGPLDELIEDIRRGILANKKPGNRDEKHEEAKSLKKASEMISPDHRSVLLRKTVQLREAPVRALLHISGLGYYKLHVNGDRVGNRELAPSKTDYRLQVLYDSYDVTSNIRGHNIRGHHTYFLLLTRCGTVG